MEIDLQQEAIRRIKAGESLFLTGSGGVGKSWVIDQVVDQSTVLCAPSGIAALNIGGITCHRAFGLPIGIPTESDYFPNRKVRELFQGNTVKRIIIDEIGIFRTDYLVLINRKLQNIRGNTRPFGGIQMVFVGDFYQLEPILSSNEREFFDFKSKFCFSSALWDLPTIELTEVKRQENKRQVLMLNSIRRKDRFYMRALNYIQKECKAYDPIDPEVFHLCCYNRDADVINDKHFNKIDEPVHNFQATISENWGKDRPVDSDLRLKVGARVLICQNSAEDTYVNGERGIVVRFGYDGVDRYHYVFVKKDSGETVAVVPAIWEKHSYKKQTRVLPGQDSEEILIKTSDATYSQIPLKLGWAVSIHKSQGMTLDNVAIDVGTGCFSHGQAYVALSRAKDLRNISFVRPMLPEDVIVRPEVKRFYGDA